MTADKLRVKYIFVAPLKPCQTSTMKFLSKQLAAKAYFRRRTEERRDEIISARLGSAWHASVLDEENIAVLKQIY